MKKSNLFILAVSILALALCLGMSSSTMAEQIKIGGIMDTSGATSDVGKDYAIGMDEAMKWINDQGGINGKKIKYTWFDYGYRIPEAITKYKLLKRLGVVAVMGWGTGDTEALSPTVHQDQIPYISASFSAHLTDPKDSGYNFFFSADYSTHARAALTVWFDEKWPQHPDYGKRKPRMACCFQSAHPYCTAPIEAIKDQAKILGFEVGPDQDVALTALDTKSQIMALKKFKPDVLWHGNTVMSVAATIKDAYALGLETDWILNTWGFDENLPKLAGKAAEGAMGVTPNVFFGQEAKHMDRVMDTAKKYNPGIPPEKRTLQTVKAWCQALMLREALMRADEAGDISGPGIRDALETMDGYEIGLGAFPVSFSKNDHRPSSGALIQQWKDGKFHKVKKIDIKERWPEKWANEWLGW